MKATNFLNFLDKKFNQNFAQAFSKSLILACFSTLVLSSMLGCAFLGGGQASGINWALDKNGGKVTVFSEDPGHPASTLNNGITSSENWDQGEGWQASIGATAGRGRGGRGQGGGGAMQ